MLSAVEFDRLTLVNHSSDFIPTVTMRDMTPLPASSPTVADDAPVASPHPMHPPDAMQEAAAKMGVEGTPAAQAPPAGREVWSMFPP